MQSRTKNMGSISLRPTEPDDEEFLVRVFASTREAERETVQWDDGEWDAFIETQFSCQKEHYEKHFPSSERLIVLRDNEPAGQIWVWRTETQIRLLDLAILPSHRDAGIGSRLIRDLQEEATHSGKPLRHMVERDNRAAMRLYRRLGFAALDEQGMYFQMEWRPPPGGPSE
jgi:ribosomal protein S18 acetylase RimI-like enzyme